MRKIVTLMLLGTGWLVLGGCEQEPLQEPAEGLPQNETPRAEPDLQIGQGDPVQPGEPATPGNEPGALPETPPPAGEEPGGQNEPPLQ